MDYIDTVIFLMEDKQYCYSDACDVAWDEMNIQNEITEIARQRNPILNKAA